MLAVALLVGLASAAGPHAFAAADAAPLAAIGGPPAHGVAAAPPPPLPLPEQGGKAELLELQQAYEGFQLAGAQKASLREINGGRLCVGARGLEPPGYELNGAISLHVCARIAGEQTGSIGFRWGRVGYDREAYRRFAGPVGIPGALALYEPVPLGTLFTGDRNFTCVVFMTDSQGELPPFRDTVLTRKYGYTSKERASGNYRRLTSRGFNREAAAGTYKMPPELRKPGSEVCAQRWTLLEFFVPEVSEMWFCYTLQTHWPECQATRRTFLAQGCFFAGGAVIVLAVLAHIMRKQSQLVWALRWCVCFLVHLELGLGSVAILLIMGVDRTGLAAEVLFCSIATLMIIGGYHLLMLPYILCEGSEDLSSFSVFYLFALAFSPCLFAEYMCYYPAFPLLVYHRPMLLGSLGFVLETARKYLLQDPALMLPGPMKDDGGRPFGELHVRPEYAPMHLTSGKAPFITRA